MLAKRRCFPPYRRRSQTTPHSAVRALMVEVKQPMRSTSVAGKARGGGKYASKGKGRKVAATRSRSNKVAARSRKAAASAARIESKPAANSPLNLRKANAKPAKKISGKSRGSSS